MMMARRDLMRDVRVLALFTSGKTPLILCPTTLTDTSSVSDNATVADDSRQRMERSVE